MQNERSEQLHGPGIEAELEVDIALVKSSGDRRKALKKASSSRGKDSS